MEERLSKIKPGWWTALFLVFVIGVTVMTAGLFSGTFRSSVPVMLTSDRAGLVMESGADVKLRGMPVGRVANISGGGSRVGLELELEPDQIKYIPANIEARIRATTAFGAKYVDLIYPEDPTSQRISAGAVIQSKNVSVEVNTVFQNLLNVLQHVEPDKLNGALSALAEGLRGQGPQIGQAITDANEVLSVLNSRADLIKADWQSFKGFNDAYSAAAPDIIETLDNASTTATTITENAQALDALLLSTIGLSDSGIQLIAPNKDNLVNSVNVLSPTTDLLFKYNPTYTCLFTGAKWLIDHGLAEALGANGKSAILDASLVLGDDKYNFPKNLPIVGAKGGPGGKPGCGSLPDPTKQYPIRQLITNTGWGTGNDIRVNPGIGFPGYANYFPVTRAAPEPPSVRNQGNTAPPPLNGPPHGAPLYAPDGTPLFPGLPPAPPPGAPRDPAPRPGSEPFTPAVPAQVQPTPLSPAPVPPPPLPPLYGPPPGPAPSP
ncbi:MCE family protein [Mycobacterium sp. GA-2829]|uniref:MCE family protein n=1 Tax=Mycobacterium sp. GA-2829 TaxID=1772283 RepID=UPI0007401C2B|nr:MCE family protein [Mycobacterium sp. GA-2829]KUI29339.1 MCE-family protein MCE3A [Mycobacterium sp. GA-2829]